MRSATTTFVLMLDLFSTRLLWSTGRRFTLDMLFELVLPGDVASRGRVLCDVVYVGLVGMVLGMILGMVLVRTCCVVALEQHGLPRCRPHQRWRWWRAPNVLAVHALTGERWNRYSPVCDSV